VEGKLRDDEVPVPELKPGEVLVRVHAVGLNPLTGTCATECPSIPPELRPPLSLPVIPGTNLSGVVADVDGFSADDEVSDLRIFPFWLSIHVLFIHLLAPCSLACFSRRLRVTVKSVPDLLDHSDIRISRNVTDRKKCR
jgi:hypothetical protein